MKRIIITALVVVAGLSSGLAAAEPERIGVYDSRAIAIAWAGTEPFSTWLKDLRSRHQAAVEAGDTELAAKLEGEGVAMQARLHRQGFSTAPVDDILARFKEQVAGVLEEAGVTVLISKWDEAQLALHPDAEQVDLTMKLVEAMGTSAKQLNSVRQIGDTPPIPLAKLEKMLAKGEM